MIVTQPFDGLYSFLNFHLGLRMSEDLRIIGQVKDDSLAAVVAYNNFTGTCCQMHVVGGDTGWMTRDLLWYSFYYPFEFLKLKVVIGLVEATNEKALSLNVKLGFKETHRIADAYPSGDMVVMEMRKADASKWLALGNRYG